VLELGSNTYVHYAHLQRNRGGVANFLWMERSKHNQPLEVGGREHYTMRAVTKGDS
jgi:hypothetical protein